MSDGKNGKKLQGAQLRAARGLLGIAASVLANESGVSLRTIRRAEVHHGPLTIAEDNVLLLTKALEARGVIFSFDGSAGVSLRQRPKPRFGD